jgi:hypothetical protein
VALFLISTVLTFVAGGTWSTRHNLEEALEDTERAVRFGSDEATLRNTITRIHYNLSEDPQTFLVQYGPNDDFVIPTKVIEFDEKEDEDDEKAANLAKKISNKFKKVTEFEEDDKEIPAPVRLVGIGSGLTETLYLASEYSKASIYLYPSGEKDRAMVIFATDDEIATITISPFMMEFEREFYTIEEAQSGEDLIEQQDTLAAQFFSEWLGDKKTK